jgi:alpha-N-arabinofuranosidase
MLNASSFLIKFVVLLHVGMLYAQTFTNPVLPGGYPDPSICKVGDVFYMANSSFEYFPGIPIHSSKDLVNWTLIGHGLQRETQCNGVVNLIDVQPNGGIYAPTLRYHEGTFYIITTAIYFDEETKKHSGNNIIITATNPAGPWSDPVVVQGAPGIDPDLYFDEEGRLWYTGQHKPNNPEFIDQKEIWMQELDLETFQLIGARHFLWRGACDGVWTEGPHIYKNDGRYYLMIAEGGTSFNHAVMVAASDKLTGPYVSNPRNPIFTSRQLSYENWVHSTGHGDLVKLDDGRWFMFLLGVRGDLNRKSNMGRETFVVPVSWERDMHPRKDKILWPVVAPKTGRIERVNPVIFDGTAHTKDLTFYDDFKQDVLSRAWNFVRVPMPNTYSLDANPGHLRLFTHPNTISRRKRAHFMGIKQTESDFVFTSKMHFNPSGNESAAGIAIVQKDDTYVSFSVRKKAEGMVVEVVHKNKKIAPIKTQLLKSYKGEIRFKLVSANDTYTFSYATKGKRYKVLTTTTADLVLFNGFTGAHVGLYATSNGQDNTDFSDYDWINYLPKTRK